MTNNLTLIEQYNGHNIWSDEGAICVNTIPDGKEYLFYIGLDDSKQTGKRQWNDTANNTDAAKQYIDSKKFIPNS